MIALQGDQLVLERLDLGARADWGAMARMLAKLHRTTSGRFGWARDNWIGLAPQTNGWSDDWAEFFLEKRLRPQAQWAAANGFRIDLPDVNRFLGHHPGPSLLHGDLWSGNAGFTREGPVLFDPAVYYGDREADLAMTELFGGFPREFYAAYEAELPLAPGYARRRDVYNLYHVLNHLNLFGAGYLAQAKALLERLA